jgi:hypothetical protein
MGGGGATFPSRPPRLGCVCEFSAYLSINFFKKSSASGTFGRQSVAFGRSGSLSTTSAESTKQSMIPSNLADGEQLRPNLTGIL